MIPDSRGRFVGVHRVPWAVSVDDAPAEKGAGGVKKQQNTDQQTLAEHKDCTDFPC